MNFNKKYDYTKVMELYKLHKNDREISDETEIPRGAIQKWRQKNNLAANSKYNNVNSEQFAIMEKMYMDGKSDYAIATTLGIDTQRVGYWRKKNGYNPHFTSNYRLKYTEDYFPKVDNKDKPWRDPESLFCDTEFLEDLLNKPIQRVNKNE